MADELSYTDNGDGTVTLNNDPAPAEIAVGRILWEQMVRGELTWATVTEEPSSDPENPNPVQVLTVSATNVAAVFRWNDSRARVTYLNTISWSLI